jgi:pullulanase/glycogen debranching enzyme
MVQKTPFYPHHLFRNALVADLPFDWTGARERHSVTWAETIIYELHVRGFAKRIPFA